MQIPKTIDICGMPFTLTDSYEEFISLGGETFNMDVYGGVTDFHNQVIWYNKKVPLVSLKSNLIHEILHCCLHFSTSSQLEPHFETFKEIHEWACGTIDDSLCYVLRKNMEFMTWYVTEEG